MSRFLDAARLGAFSPEAFAAKRPFPWQDFQALLRPEGFRELLRDFPALELFEKHEGIGRHHGQRPHDRYYLAYEVSRYKDLEHPPGQGIVRHEGLPPSWQAFIGEIETSREYREFIRAALEVREFEIRYAWHLGVSRSDVSPHLDAERKAGTHIFYFNTAEDWDPAWGGETLVLGDKRVDGMAPDFGDFELAIPTPFVGNRSFLFRNGPHAWHGVRGLACPQGRHRRLFNVIFEHPRRRGAARLFSAPWKAGRRILRRGLRAPGALQT